MKLEKRKKWCLERICDLTMDLDQMAGLDERLHYIMKNTHKPIEEDSPAYFIRVPGGTVGSVWLEDGCIRDIFIDTNYVVKSYPEDVNERIKKYIGERIEDE